MPEESIVIKGIKGFNSKLQCLGYQFEVGKEYEHPGEVKCCPNQGDIQQGRGGFHFCENPLDTFAYYEPGTSRYCEVEGLGQTQRHNQDSKVACTRLKVGAEIGLKQIIEGGIKFMFERTKWSEENSTKENGSGAQATGYRSGAQATGDSSGAQATGYSSGAQATGDRSMATTNGAYSSSCVEGENSVAMAMGIEGKAKGKKGSWLVLAEWEQINYEWRIKAMKCAPVDGEAIKEDTWYRLIDGKFVDAEEA